MFVRNTYIYKVTTSTAGCFGASLSDWEVVVVASCCPDFAPKKLVIGDAAGFSTMFDFAGLAGTDGAGAGAGAGGWTSSTLYC
jgi:hypothetical protein